MAHRELRKQVVKDDRKTEVDPIRCQRIYQVMLLRAVTRAPLT